MNVPDPISALTARPTTPPRQVTHAIGIDIGGTGIKAARVELRTGALTSERLKLATPDGGRPDDIAATVLTLLDQLAPGDGEPIGVCFPAVVRRGVTMSAANVSKKWIGFAAEEFFESKIGRSISFINDADAAGVAEARYGAAAGVAGLTIVTTLGTGIGSALLYNGMLIPNSELGHLEIDGKDAERRAAYSAMEREHLDWKQWTKRLQRYYEVLEALFSPDLLVVGGGVSKNSAEFFGYLRLDTPIVAAQLLNNAGIVGAAALAH